ncbi:MAG: hypothetical protein LC667_07280 [Thioalkalivibrio sp.]|nr:hypothetical protein [Thioalkalivibrio sp.]
MSNPSRRLARHLARRFALAVALLLSGLALGSEHIWFEERINVFDDRDTSYVFVGSNEYFDAPEWIWALLWRCDGASDYEVIVDTSVHPDAAAAGTPVDLSPPSSPPPVIYRFDDHDAIASRWTSNTRADGAFLPRRELDLFTLTALTSDQLIFGFADRNAASNTSTLGRRTFDLVGLRRVLEQLACIPDRVLELADP